MILRMPTKIVSGLCDDDDGGVYDHLQHGGDDYFVNDDMQNFNDTEDANQNCLRVVWPHGDSRLLCLVDVFPRLVVLPSRRSMRW